MALPDRRHLPPLSALRAFEATARLGGFAQAARALNVTHPAVSQQVRSLERELGVSLVVRDGRGLALTAEGERLAAGLGEGFATISASVDAVRRGERARGLRISCTPALTQSVLMPGLAGFWREHPEIPVSLSPTYDVVDLRHEGFDLAIRTGNGKWPGVEAELLAEAQYILVGAPDLLARGTDVRRLPWIAPFDPVEERLLRDSGIDPDDLIVNGIDAPIMSVPAAVQGYGLLFVADIVVRSDIASGRLVRVPFRDLPRFAYWIVTLPGARRPAVASFVAWLKALLAAPETGAENS